jgi:hypothetical protein
LDGRGEESERDRERERESKGRSESMNRLTEGAQTDGQKKVKSHKEIAWAVVGSTAIGQLLSLVRVSGLV